MANQKTNWQELKAIIISAALLGFIFGFDDGSSTFILSFWLRNFILQFVMSLIFVMIFVKVTKAYSTKKGISTNFAVWHIERYGLKRSSTFKSRGIPAGIIFPLLISVLSLGKLFFSAVLSPKFSKTPASRLGKKFENPTTKEIALISSIGPITLTIIGIFLAHLNSSFALIPFSIAFSTMIPISKLNGTSALVGAPAIYIFSMAMIIVSFYLSAILSIAATILLGLFICLALMIIFYYHIYTK